MLLETLTIHDVLFSNNIKRNASDMALCDDTMSISWQKLREHSIILGC